MKEIIKCYSNEDIKNAEIYFYKKGYRYLTGDKHTGFKMKDIGNEYKKEVYILFDGDNIFHAISDICATPKLILDKYIERKPNGELISSISVFKKRLTLIKWWFKIKLMSDIELENLIEYLENTK